MRLQRLWLLSRAQRSIKIITNWDLFTPWRPYRTKSTFSEASKGWKKS
jgi:hypothetical protein